MIPIKSQHGNLLCYTGWDLTEAIDSHLCLCREMLLSESQKTLSLWIVTPQINNSCLIFPLLVYWRSLARLLPMLVLHWQFTSLSPLVQSCVLQSDQAEELWVIISQHSLIPNHVKWWKIISNNGLIFKCLLSTSSVFSTPSKSFCRNISSLNTFYAFLLNFQQGQKDTFFPMRYLRQ